MFCYSPKHCFRLFEGQQYHCWSEKSPAVGLELPTLGIQGQRLHHSSGLFSGREAKGLFFSLVVLAGLTQQPARDWHKAIEVIEIS